MNYSLNKEKLLYMRLSMKLRRLWFRRPAWIAEHARNRRSMAIVDRKLESWVAEGKHRLCYGSMDDILSDLGLTSGELSAYCTKKLGRTFLTWRKEIRMEEAKRLLLEHPDIPACKIGGSLGITDKSNFRHQFKSVTGLTPCQWRENHLKK